MVTMGLYLIEDNPAEVSAMYCFPVYYYYLMTKYILLNFLSLDIFFFVQRLYCNFFATG